MEVVATSRWVRVTARKARLVAAGVTGMPVADALAMLTFSPRGVAIDVAKVIKSAAANAEHNYNLDASSLRVARVEVEGGMIIKRFRPKPRGMAGSIFKRTSHLRAYVTDGEVAGTRRGPVRGVTRGFDKPKSRTRVPAAPQGGEKATRTTATKPVRERKPAGGAAKKPATSGAATAKTDKAAIATDKSPKAPKARTAAKPETKPKAKAAPAAPPKAPAEPDKKATTNEDPT